MKDFLYLQKTPNGLRAFRKQELNTLTENLILKKINGVNMNPLKFILTQLFGIRILNIVIMNQCITTISGMMLMLIILKSVFRVVQAKAFAHWRTAYYNQHTKSQRRNSELASRYRLPTEAEWEYAARGGIERAEYPMGSPYTTDDKGCFLANFKPERGDYTADQILYTAEAESYWPNDFGLFNMSGNVSEWTDSNYEKSSNDFVSGLNPNLAGSGFKST